MWVSSVQLHHFRNYEQVATGFSEGLNLVFGDNGRGKTNLIEGIYFLGALESHRSASNSVLVAHSKDSATISITANANARQLVVAAEINKNSANRYFLNGNQVRKASEISGVLKAVIFSPEDLDLVRRDPQDRRSFLDQALTLIKPRLQGVKSDYERVLKQRNALLKSARQVSNPDLTTLEIWNDRLVSLGSEILKARLSLVSDLQPLLASFYKSLADSNEEITLRIQSSISGVEEDGAELGDISKEEIESLFHEKLTLVRSQELERGITLVGPHRDELMISKSGLPARSQSSQGEAWSIALGLKLSLAALLRENSQTGDPVLLLDDVFAVLDAGRRERLVQFVSEYQQVIITSADRESAPQLRWEKEIEVISGGVRES